jgi:two-component system chemotaxis sensor kinase CheA
MENFKAKFKEEAFEHIADIEQALLNLEDNPENHELIEKVFRAMHSLKGGGAMFGFELLSDFTHDLETIYDLIRNSKLALSKSIFSLTLKSVDHIKTLVEASDNKLDDTTQEIHDSLINEIDEVVNQKSESAIDDAIRKSFEQSVEAVKHITYLITFSPHPDIFENGTNPLYLVDDIYNLGETLVLSDLSNVPAFDQLEPTKCFTSWKILLSTEHQQDDIKDIFMFVEELADIRIEKLSEGNLVKRKSFRKRVKDLVKEKGRAEIEDLLKITEQSGSSLADKVKKAINKTENKSNNAISSIRVSSDKLDELMNLVSELVTTQARLSLYAESKTSNELVSISENVQKLSRQLRDIAFSIVLVPIETLITRFHRLVRDLSHELGKEVAFRSEGTETELDKTIIENLTDPLLHMIRNSIDHGIESGDEREKKGKHRRGEILLKAFYSGANVVIQIIDDGAGIDIDYIRQKAIEKGLTTKDANLSKKDILDFLFAPGFSTAKRVTDVSGRGVGMDVVRQQISKIRGEIELDSELEKGTTVTLKLPLTLSIIDGLLVKVEETYFVIPLSAVEKIHAVEQEHLFKQFNDLVTLDNEQIPYLHLRKEFDLAKSENSTEQVIVITYEEKRVGLVVDSIIGEYQAVLKPLGKYYKNQDIISGATILGDGTVALVLDTNKTINQFAIQNV